MSDWIEWNGGFCPVIHGTLVDVEFRDGVKAFKIFAGYTIDKYPCGHDGRIATEWIHHGWQRDIIAYRLAEPVAAEPISEPVATINIDDALDELSEIMSIWLSSRQNGRTPRHIKTAILSMIKEISQQ